MENKDILELVRFSAEKMRKINLFETDNFFCDIYCLEPGQEQQVHEHKIEDKIYFVLSGIGSFTVGGEVKDLGENQVILAPAGKPHGVRNSSNAQLTLLVFMTPNPNRKKAAE